MSFKTIPLRRGFNGVEIFYNLCQQHNAVICGGYARYCASPLPTAKVVVPGDVDIFPRTEESSLGLLESIKKLGYEIKHEISPTTP